jgi:hypothetical protein
MYFPIPNCDRWGLVILKNWTIAADVMRSSMSTGDSLEASSTLVLVVLAFLFILGIILAIRDSYCPGCTSFFQLRRTYTTLVEATYSSEGKRQVRCRCRCGYRREYEEILPRVQEFDAP